jgi:peptidylprolyl isomerase
MLDRYERRRRGSVVFASGWRVRRSWAMSCPLAAVVLACAFSPSAAAQVGTPTRGPLSKKPTIRSHNGPPPGRLVRRDILKGTGRRAKSGDSLTVNYVDALYSSNKVFDSSWSREETFTFTFGKGEVIEGWEQGLAGMRVGGRRELIIPPLLLTAVGDRHLSYRPTRRWSSSSTCSPRRPMRDAQSIPVHEPAHLSSSIDRQRKGGDSNSRDGGYPPAGFQDRCIQPLCHPSTRSGRLVHSGAHLGGLTAARPPTSRLGIRFPWERWPSG